MVDNSMKKRTIFPGYLFGDNRETKPEKTKNTFRRRETRLRGVCRYYVRFSEHPSSITEKSPPKCRLQLRTFGPRRTVCKAIVS